MIYLIGGTPRSGKTTLAKKIVQSIGGNYLQTDYISSALSSKMSEDEEKSLFGEKSRNDSNWKDNETRFSVFSNEEQIEIYKKKATWNRSGIRNMIDYGIADQETLIFEGYHLRPSIIHEDIMRRGKQIKYILLYKSDITEIEQGIKANKHPNDRAIKHTHNDATYPKIASFLYDFGQVLHDESTLYNINTYDTSCSNFKERIDSICTKITSQ